MPARRSRAGASDSDGGVGDGVSPARPAPAAVLGQFCGWSAFCAGALTPVPTGIVVWPGCAIYASRVPVVELNVFFSSVLVIKGQAVELFIPVAGVRLGLSAGLSASSVVSKGSSVFRSVCFGFLFPFFLFFSFLVSLVLLLG